MQLQSLNTVTTMSSREIADLVESRHDVVKKSIERLIERGTIHKPPMVDYEIINGLGITTYGQEYKIGKRDSYVIVAQLSPEFTAKLVDRWQELESQHIPKTLPEALRLAADLAEKNLALENKIAIDAPKVEFAMAVRNMEGSCHLGVFCKTLTPTIGRNTFFKWLRSNGVLDERNIPYQKYKDSGYFVVIEQTPYTDSQGKSHPAFTTLVTGKGQVWLEKQYRG